jgi:hypothetical protein
MAFYKEGKELMDWLKEHYPPRDVDLFDRNRDWDYACRIWGWCIQWDGCPELYRCPEGKKQRSIYFPPLKVRLEMTPEERMKWQKQQFKEKTFDFIIADGITTHICTIWGWCVSEQYTTCKYTINCPEYYENRKKKQEPRTEF